MSLLAACDKPSPQSVDSSTPAANSAPATAPSSTLSGDKKDLKLGIVPLSLRVPAEWKLNEAGGVMAIEGPLPGASDAEIIISRLRPMDADRTRRWFAAANAADQSRLFRHRRTRDQRIESVGDRRGGAWRIARSAERRDDSARPGSPGGSPFLCGRHKADFALQPGIFGDEPGGLCIAEGFGRVDHWYGAAGAGHVAVVCARIQCSRIFFFAALRALAFKCIFTAKAKSAKKREFGSRRSWSSERLGGKIRHSDNVF